MRTIKPPPEWQVSCEMCDAVLAYDHRDVHARPYLDEAYITCPHCKHEIDVPTEYSDREEVSND